ncbi:MAG: hypothetical protein V3T32_03365, partial [Thermodesulfobacteriota bacterium]
MKKLIIPAFVILAFLLAAPVTSLAKNYRGGGHSYGGHGKNYGGHGKNYGGHGKNYGRHGKNYGSHGYNRHGGHNRH